MTIKNYAELCKLLGDSVKGGDSKKYQVKDWTRYFDFAREGRKFIIKQIHTEPKPKQQGNERYLRTIEKLLNYSFGRCDYGVYNSIKKGLFTTLGMINPKFGLSYYQLTRDKTTEVSEWNYMNFHVRANDKLSGILFSALNSMQKRKLLSYSKIYYIVEPHKDKNSVYLKSREAEEYEYELIEKAGVDALIELKWETINPFKRSKYYDKVNELLKDREGWDSVYKSIKIIPNEALMSEEIEKIRDSEELSALRMHLNGLIIDTVNTHAQYRFDKDFEKFLSQHPLKVGSVEVVFRDHEKCKWIDPTIFPNDYIEKQQMLSERLLRIRG